MKGIPVLILFLISFFYLTSINGQSEIDVDTTSEFDTIVMITRSTPESELIIKLDRVKKLAPNAKIEYKYEGENLKMLMFKGSSVSCSSDNLSQIKLNIKGGKVQDCSISDAQ